MKKVFLLLRNNHEKGPFTVEELLQQHLRPTDLVWVEGISLAWAYPSEVPELKTYFSGTAYTLPSVHYQITDASHNDDIELRAEEIRQKILSFTPKYYNSRPLQQNPLHNSSIPAFKQDEIEFIDHRKKETHAFEWVSAAMVTLVVVAGFFGGQRLILSKRHVGNPVVTRSVNADTHAAKAYNNTSRNTVASSLPVIDSGNQVVDSVTTISKKVNTIAIKTPKPRDSAKKVLVKDTVANNVALTETPKIVA
ncbi:MAG TPA: DUF4339 domain-containing protein, partial [Flavisolibacter sp.]|nr:DUF4339 domain-containing protein [Flavisolibacter sp.]